MYLCHEGTVCESKRRETEKKPAVVKTNGGLSVYPGTGCQVTLVASQKATPAIVKRCEIEAGNVQKQHEERVPHGL